MSITFLSGGVMAPTGFKATGIHAGIRKNSSKKDLALIACEASCAAAAVYTQNAVQGAPLTVTRENLRDGSARAVVCNSGYANTCAQGGIAHARMMCDATAGALGIHASDVIVASTGIIGQTLPIDTIVASIPRLAEGLSQGSATEAAEAIMTTDTHPKEAAAELIIDGTPCRIGGMAKGSGMIHPNMATMLCFLTTDVSITPDLLDAALREAVDESFHMVSIDGDTSTNDMVTVMASGLSGAPLIRERGSAYRAFADALTALCVHLARQIAQDGEGATHLIICEVTGAPSRADARAAAKSVICSSLVKTAIFGADANWGRVLCALGYANTSIDPDAVDVSFVSEAGRADVCRGGAPLDFDEALATAVLSAAEVTIAVNLHHGEYTATAYGCDLSYDYVRINGEYRT